MKILRHTQPRFAKALAALKRHAEPTDDVRATVAEIIRDIRKRGDAALRDYTVKFGGPKLDPDGLRLTQHSRVHDDDRKAIAIAHKNVFAFAKKSLRKSWSGRNTQGARVGERFDPFQRVGVYVPGGTAPLVSTAVMTV